jgi:hypothetical protein
VVDSNAEVGQLATPSSQLARLVGTQHFWVRVAIPADKLPFIRIPGIDGDKGSSVVVKQAVGRTEVTRTGSVTRLLSDREASSRMARVMVRIDDPYGFEQADESGARPYPILLNTYVDVIIAGKQEKRLVEVPRSAVHEGNVAYVFEPQGSQLSIRKLSVAWTLPDTLLVEAGLKDDERVVTSPLTSAVDGMKLREVPAIVSTPDAAPGGVPDG